MPSIDRLRTDHALALLGVIGRIKHDLGKYIALQQRWVGEQASVCDRRAAAQADLLSTRRGPNGRQDAATVWAGFEAALAAEGLPDVSDDEDIAEIRAAMSVIADVIDALRSGTDGEIELALARREALRVSHACRSLARRVRSRAEGVWPTAC